MGLMSMFRKFIVWLKKEYLDDPYEATALVAFGIGCPFILIIFAVTLYLIKLFEWSCQEKCSLKTPSY